MSDSVAMAPSTIPELWVPVVVFSHVFALFWFARMWMLHDPDMFARIFKKLFRSSADAEKAVELEIRTEDMVATLVKQPPTSNSFKDTKDKGDQFHDAEAGTPVSEGSSDATPEHMVVEKVHLDWHRLGCSYKSAGGTKVVLHDIWGSANPGEMQALLGPSGAGKSTLMDILAQRKSVGNLAGTMLVNGRLVTNGFIRKTAYVPQEDNFIATMTGLETMRFHADIVLPQNWTKQQRRDRVAEVLGAVGLASQARSLVGGTLPGGLMLRGLSGGERKRLSIAAGILASPSVVFLDEPTSGLDSFAALTVMGYLKCMARDAGHVVIASIHQPRSAIWTLFDKVTILASGRLMYHGACDHMVDWFVSLGYPYDASLHGVPSDWVLDLVAIGFAKPKRFYGHTIRSPEELQDASAQFLACYQASETVMASSSRGGGEGNARPFNRRMAYSLRQKESKYASNWGRQWMACYGRELLSITRNPADVAGRTLTFTWVALLMGLLYYRMSNGAESIQGRLNLAFNTLAFFCLMPYISMSLYSAGKKFYIADASSKLYRPHAYYIAKVCATTPFQIISSLVFTFTVYGMSGLRSDSSAILQNGFISCVLSLIAVQVLHCCAILAPNQDAAFMLSIVWTAIQLLMSNFFITFNAVLFQWLTQLRWLSALYYAFEGLAVAEFGGKMLDCSTGMSADGIAYLKNLLPKTRFLSNQLVLNSLQNPGTDCVADTSAVLNFFGFGRPFAVTAGVLVSYLIICHIATYTAMVVVARKERR